MTSEFHSSRANNSRRGQAGSARAGRKVLVTSRGRGTVRLVLRGRAAGTKSEGMPGAAVAAIRLGCRSRSPTVGWRRQRIRSSRQAVERNRGPLARLPSYTVSTVQPVTSRSATGTTYDSHGDCPD
jgi:hypothetical protein